MISAALKWIQDNSDLFFDLIRVYVGVGLFVRGLLALLDPSFLAEWMARFGVSGAASDAARLYVIAAHLIGGLLLAVGLLTRIAALINIPILIGAVFFIHYPQGLATTDQSLEFSALVLFLLTLFLLRGHGRLSLTVWLQSRESSGG